MRTKKAALRCVLSEKLRENQLVVLRDLDLPTHKTKDLTAVAALLGVTGRTLLVDRRGNENLRRAAANHPKLIAIMIGTNNLGQTGDDPAWVAAGGAFFEEFGAAGGVQGVALGGGVLVLGGDAGVAEQHDCCIFCCQTARIWQQH